jgi:hypothetical protein
MEGTTTSAEQKLTSGQLDNEKTNQKSPKKRGDFLCIPGYFILRKENFISANITKRSDKRCILIQYQLAGSAKEVEISDQFPHSSEYLLENIYSQLES